LPFAHAESQKRDGEWRQYRGDGQLSGRSELLGQINRQPGILWQHDIGGRKTLLTAQLGVGEASLNLPNNAAQSNGFWEGWQVLSRRLRLAEDRVDMICVPDSNRTREGWKHTGEKYIDTVNQYAYQVFIGKCRDFIVQQDFRWRGKGNML